MILGPIVTHAPNVYYSAAENSPRQTHNSLLFQGFFLLKTAVPSCILNICWIYDSLSANLFIYVVIFSHDLKMQIHGRDWKQTWLVLEAKAVYFFFTFSVKKYIQMYLKYISMGRPLAQLADPCALPFFTKKKGTLSWNNIKSFSVIEKLPIYECVSISKV